MINNKSKFFLFTDGSINPQTHVGYGAYLFLSENQLNLAVSMNDVKIKRFENSNSSKLELETLLWALGEISLDGCKLTIYTDCQNTISLKDRRERFKKNDYMSKTNKRIKNHEIYREFFKAIDAIDCEFVKVKGHKKKENKDKIDKIFTFVDIASRTALRKLYPHKQTTPL
ncbi:RNase H family protein [Sulfurimonas sp.]|uniref:ribonuclease HI n=1 Tax=Sulfurimonas sp. TaxID=2022749 RepID=UPI0025DDB43E|nr:RNase H family protein [Sulfurimonas sp.]MDD5157042.1 ribonuclease H [Sulfurimonas sp.]